MNRLAAWLATTIRGRIGEGAGAGAQPEGRLIFHGPPLEILEEVFSILANGAGDGKQPAVPVLLQVPSLPAGQPNPSVGVSGLCDENHLLDLRNSPDAPSFLALVPPGQQAIRSISSTTDEFGVAAGSNGANVSFDQWWNDYFVQAVVEAAIRGSGLPEPEREEAHDLARRAARAMDDVDAGSGRLAAWMLLARLHDAPARIEADGMSAAAAISLACGVPPMAGGRLSAREQQSSLDSVASALSNGFRSGLQPAFDTAAAEQRLLLEQFLEHIRAACDTTTALERSPEAFYAPGRGAMLLQPPRWWMGLDAELWAALLNEQPEVVGDIRVRCDAPLLPPSKGSPVLVASEVKLVIGLDLGDKDHVGITVERTAKKSSDGFPREMKLEGEAFLIDPAPPPHRSPIQYKVGAAGYRQAAVKVISLASWQPGIFVTCRLAKKVVPPKIPSRKTKGRGPQLEASMSLPGPGRYEVLVFMSPGATMLGASGGEESDREDDQRLLEPKEVSPHCYQVEVEAESSYKLDVEFERIGADGKAISETCRVFLACEETSQEGCSSEFERLIKLNRRQVDPSAVKSVVQLNRSARASTLQGWILQEDSVARSFLPVVLAEDYASHWMQPDWGPDGQRILSSGRFLRDPRPPAADFAPPPGFVTARMELACYIRGVDDQAGLVEAAPLGDWLAKDEKFAELLEQYLESYMQWLAAAPSVAAWSDLVVVASLEAGGRTLSRIPDAVLLSPLHPLRLCWHALAQRMLSKAATDLPCPAASILDPGKVPDILTVPLVSPEGIEEVPFLSVHGSSDYWPVLWNVSRLRDLPARAQAAPFEPAFGVTIGGLTGGFSASQVGRALDDVSDVLCAKPTISIVVASAGGTTDACNEGLVAWSAGRYAGSEGVVHGQSAGPRRLDVFDTRDAATRAEDTTISNLSEDTRNQVRWFMGQPTGTRPDLGIIAQLDSAEPDVADTLGTSPLGEGALIRHRVRRQLPGAFLSEARQGRAGSPSGDRLTDKVASCIALVENQGSRSIGLRFAPNVHAITDMLEAKGTDFVAVSSSAIDPACFLGGWLKQAYLWDYELPSYSQRAGDTDGYYLISRIRPSDRDGLKAVLERLPGCDSLEAGQVEAILLEIARRGIPTIRGLAGNNSGAAGDLGLFLAGRLLQDQFRPGRIGESMLPVTSGDVDKPVVTLVLPVDPFQRHLDDLARALQVERGDASLLRPDLLVVSIALGSTGTRLRLTPVEVKYRQSSTFPVGEAREALGQARALSELLGLLARRDEAGSLWRLAYQHLLLSLVGFGMRVYSQHQDLVGNPDDWARFHEQAATAILGSENCVEVDPRGRLVVVDDSPHSDAYDHDGDGFRETIVISSADAGRIVLDQADDFYQGVRTKVGDWGLRAAAADNFGSVDTGASGDGQAEGEIALPQDGMEESPSTQEPSGDPALAGNAAQDPGKGICLAVGRTVDGFSQRDVSLALSNTKLNQLNIGVVGDLGTGKTQLLKSLIYQIASAAEQNRGIKPRFLIFDYKRDYSSPDFVAATGARVVKPHRLPLNLFDTSGMAESQAPWLDRFRFFSDVLDKIYSGIGPVQLAKLKKAVRTAYDSADGGAPTIYDVHSAYADLLDGKSDSPMSIIDDLVDMEIFESNPSSTRSFDAFLDGVVVVSLDALGQDDRSKNMLVAIMLNMFYENMLRTPKRPFLGSDPQLRAIDSYLLVDEADNIMRYEFDVLRKLLLQGREFGAGVILASQYLRHFKVNATDYREPLLTWFIHKVPNVTPVELGALGLAASASDLAERVKSLPNHHCLYKSFDVPGQVLHGLPFYELMAARKGSG